MRTRRSLSRWRWRRRHRDGNGGVYATHDGTARAGEDYTARRGTLMFAAGETSKTVSVPITDDGVEDGGETLTAASGADVADATATGTIRDNEPVAEPRLSVTDAEATEEEDAALEFAVTLDTAATGTVTVDYGHVGRHRDGWRRLHGTGRDADVRGGGDVEDGVGADHGRRRRGRRRDADADAERCERRGDRRRGGDGHDQGRGGDVTGAVGFRRGGDRGGSPAAAEWPRRPARPAGSTAADSFRWASGAGTC